MCNFGLEKNGMPHKIKQSDYTSRSRPGRTRQKKNTPEEKLLLSPVKTEEDIALTLKYLNTAVKSEA